MTDVYGKDAALWYRRWRLFFLASEGLFGYANGNVWGVSHYRLTPALLQFDVEMRHDCAAGEKGRCGRQTGCEGSPSQVGYGDDRRPIS